MELFPVEDAEDEKKCWLARFSSTSSFFSWLKKKNKATQQRAYSSKEFYKGARAKKKSHNSAQLRLFKAKKKRSKEEATRCNDLDGG